MCCATLDRSLCRASCTGHSLSDAAVQGLAQPVLQVLVLQACTLPYGLLCSWPSGSSVQVARHCKRISSPEGPPSRPGTRAWPCPMRCHARASGTPRIAADCRRIPGFCGPALRRHWHASPAAGRCGCAWRPASLRCCVTLPVRGGPQQWERSSRHAARLSKV